VSEIALKEEIQSPALKVIEAVRRPEVKEQLQMALPENVSVERFVRVAATALRENEAELAKCEPQSIMAAVSRCAQDGLLPDGREAAIVRFGDQATYMPMIGGFRKIAADYGWSLRTVAIYEHDEFAYELGEHPQVVHRPARLLDDRGPLIGAYAIGVHSSGRREVEVMSSEDVEKVRSVSRAKNSGPWVDWTDRMYEKTVGRRLFAKLPLADHERVQRVLQAEAVLPEDAAVTLYGSRASVELEAAADAPAEQTGEGRETTGEQSSGRRSAAPAFAGEEPPEAPADDVVALAGEERFDAGRYQGQTVAQVHALGEVGIKYLAWAEGSWNEGRLKAAITTWNAHQNQQEEA
jgi:phage RecT family recombinase